MLTRSPAVGYRKRVSDLSVHRFLLSFAEILGRDIFVHSGDRHNVPKGGSTTSHHLEGRAADFHVSGMTDEAAFEAIRAAVEKLPVFPDQRFVLLHHGRYTATEGEHLHLGHQRVLQKAHEPWSLTFMVEGLTPGEKGQYRIVGHSRTKCYPTLVH